VAFIQSVSLVLIISNSFKRFDVNTRFPPSSDSSQANNATCNMQHMTDSNRNCDGIVPQLPQSRFPWTCPHARAHLPPFSHFDLSPPRSCHKPLLDCFVLVHAILVLFLETLSNWFGCPWPTKMDVALAFPPSAVDGSKLSCGPARSWLLQGLRPSFMTCGEVDCKGQQEDSA
jgi:hypothetical protein